MLTPFPQVLSVAGRVGNVVLSTTDISGLVSAYSPLAGSTSITTLGTITTGTWNGSVIGSAYLPVQTIYDPAGSAATVNTALTTFEGTVATTYAPLSSPALLNFPTLATTFNGSSGTQTGMAYNFVDSTTGTAGANGIAINWTTGGTGSGTKYPLSINVGGTNKFHVDTNGNVSFGVISFVGANINNASLVSNANATMTLQNWSFSTAATAVSMSTGTFTNSTGTGIGVNIPTIFTPTGTASAIGFEVNPTFNGSQSGGWTASDINAITTGDTSTGSKYLWNARLNGTSKASIDTSGSGTFTNNLTVNGFTSCNNFYPTTGSLALGLNGGYGTVATSVSIQPQSALTGTSGTQVATQIVATDATTSTGGLTVLNLKMLGTGTGSGPKNLLTLQSALGVNLGTFDTSANFTTYGANWTLNSVAVPTGLTLATAGTAGSTTYGYRIAAVSASGQVTNAGAEVTIATGNATLSATNYVTLTWTAVPGAVSYNIYGRTSGSELYMVNVSTTTYNDTGAVVTPAGALPGNPVGNSPVYKAWANQTGNLSTWQNSSGTNTAYIGPSGKINATALPTGTLVSPPGSLNIGDLWLDTTTSTQYPQVRTRAT